MKEDTKELDSTKRIDELENSLSIALDINERYQRENVALKKEMEELRAQLARVKEDHQFDKLVHEKEIESLKNPISRLRDKGF
jgi:predicted RNase H-like nuclease (RuvC/YqgF family)